MSELGNWREEEADLIVSQGRRLGVGAEDGDREGTGAYVNAMERMPPPAPASA